MKTFTVTSDFLSNAIFGIPAAKCAPDGNVIKVVGGFYCDELGNMVDTSAKDGWYYADNSAPNGLGWSARTMSGEEEVELDVVDGVVVAMRAETFIVDMFGAPGASIDFGARVARMVGVVLS